MINHINRLGVSYIVSGLFVIVPAYSCVSCCFHLVLSGLPLVGRDNLQ